MIHDYEFHKPSNPSNPTHPATLRLAPHQFPQWIPPAMLDDLLWQHGVPQVPSFGKAKNETFAIICGIRFWLFFWLPIYLSDPNWWIPFKWFWYIETWFWYPFISSPGCHHHRSWYNIHNRWISMDGVYIYIYTVNSTMISPLANQHSYGKWSFIVDLPIKDGGVS